MPWQPRRKVLPKGWYARRRPAAGRLRVPFWAGWVALIAGASVFWLAISPTLWPLMGQGAAYQCRRNAYNCSEFRTRIDAQIAYQACGGLRDGLARARLP
jgi:hypothetical protein